MHKLNFKNILFLPEGTTFGVRISGDSMEPEFHDGQIAWVLQQESVANGEIGLFALNGEIYYNKNPCSLNWNMDFVVMG